MGAIKSVMNIHKQINLFKYAEKAQRLLHERGVPFSGDGFPDLNGFDYERTIPENLQMLPYSKRNQAANPQCTILNFFEPDFLLYGYLNTLDKVAANLSVYYAVAGFDLSPCLDASIEEQKASLLINMLTNGLLMANGITVIPSMRTGNLETVTHVMKSYPRNVCWVYGAHGCNQRHKGIGGMISGIKIAICEPSEVLSYGRLAESDRMLFAEWNIPVREFEDYQTVTRGISARRKGECSV